MKNDQMSISYFLFSFNIAQKSRPVSILFNDKGETIWGDVAVGKKRSGYIAYEVDQDWQKIEFIWQWNAWDKDATMTFTAYRSDLQE